MCDAYEGSKKFHKFDQVLLREQPEVQPLLYPASHLLFEPEEKTEIFTFTLEVKLSSSLYFRDVDNLVHASLASLDSVSIVPLIFISLDAV